MNILLPILTNLIILGILTAGIFAGKRNGFKIEFSKFILITGTGIGLYFLNPILISLLLKIDFISLTAINLTYGLQLISSLTLLISFIIYYLLIILIIKTIVKKIDRKRGINPAKHIKVKGIDRKTTRQLRREERKLNRRHLSRTSKFFGIIFSLLIALMASFIIMLPIKYVTYENNYPTAYDYTMYGQLDKITNISDFIIGE